MNKYINKINTVFGTVWAAFSARFLPTKSYASVVKQFAKAQADLEALETEHQCTMDDCCIEIDALKNKIDDHAIEADQCHRTASKLKEMLS